MATFLICHGAWSAGWAWKKVRPLLRAAGHEIFTPTYTGLGERAHQAAAGVDLETHIKDVLAVIEFEDLKDFVLVGHSYGGMVATAWPTGCRSASGSSSTSTPSCRSTGRACSIWHRADKRNRRLPAARTG
jgi:alpha-beta hydrolase superfamily lysophospholipase